MFVLRAGQYARFNITQHTVNVAVAVFDPAGKQLFALDNNPIGEAEDVELIAATSGKYRLRVTASEAHAPAGRYEIMLAVVGPKRTATGLGSRPRARLRWRQPRTGVARVKRCCRLSAILSLHDSIGTPPRIRARKRERCMRSRSSTSSSEIGRRRSPMPPRPCRSRELHANDQLLGRVLDCIGEVHNNFSDKKAAIDYYMQALPLLQASGDRAGEAQTLNNLGVAYLGTGDKRKALELFDQSMRILRQLQDRRTLAQVASNIGVTYDNLGDYQRALESLQYALALRREMGDRAAEGLTLNNIGSAYSGLAEYQKALDAYLAALEIHRSIRQPMEHGRQSEQHRLGIRGVGRSPPCPQFVPGVARTVPRDQGSPPDCSCAQQYREHSCRACGLSKGHRTSYGGAGASPPDE